MKKNDPIEEEIHQANPLLFRYDKLKPRIDWKAPKGPEKKTPIKLFLIIFAALVVTVSVSLAITFYIFSGLAWSKDVTALEIINSEEILTEYEQNRSFIPDGIELSKTYKFEGTTSKKREMLDKKDYTLDYSDFVPGRFGTYEIKIFLNNDKDLFCEYMAKVNTFDLTEISLGSYRRVYYAYEEPDVRDLTIFKKWNNGKVQEAKLSEYSLSSTDYNSHVPGTYTLTATMKGNANFSLSYQVEVKNLEEADFNGRYAYTDVDEEKSEPTYYAFDIAGNVITSHNPRFTMTAISSKTVEGDVVKLACLGGNQSMVYRPSTRTLEVDGLSNGKKALCQVLRSKDKVIKFFSGDYKTEITDFVAISGHLTCYTLDYIDVYYGGCINGVPFLFVTHDNIFDSDSSVSVNPSVA